MGWTSPQSRERQRKSSELTFNEYADYYIKHRRRADGGELTEGSKRNLRADIQHLRNAFSELRLADIAPARFGNGTNKNIRKDPGPSNGNVNDSRQFSQTPAIQMSTVIPQSSRRTRGPC